MPTQRPKIITRHHAYVMLGLICFILLFRAMDYFATPYVVSRASAHCVLQGEIVETKQPICASYDSSFVVRASSAYSNVRYGFYFFFFAPAYLTKELRDSYSPSLMAAIFISLELIYWYLLSGGVYLLYRRLRPRPKNI